MRVRFNRAALADIDEITTYIAERNPRAAAGFLARFEAAAGLIGQSPKIGVRIERVNLRKVVVGSYLIIYEITSSEVIIHYVRHGARLRPWEGEQQ